MKDNLYLLTDATGLLGGNIVREFVDSGKQVRTLVMASDPASAKLPRAVEIIEGDLLNPESLDQFFTVEFSTDLIVIHVAGIVTMDPNPNEKVKRSTRTAQKTSVWCASSSSSGIFSFMIKPMDHESNWLPVPADNFMLWLRVYIPGEEILDGHYVLPLVKVVARC